MKRWVFAVNGTHYEAVVANEDIDGDPMLSLYREEEDEPILVAHLDPGYRCSDTAPWHVTVRHDDEEED